MYKNFLWLLQHVLRYRSQFFLGLVLAFFVAIFNGISLTLFIPLFDALGDKDTEFVIQFSEQERKIIQKSIFLYITSSSHILEFYEFTQNLNKNPEFYIVPEAPKKINKILANKYLYYLNKLSKEKFKDFTTIERLQINYIIRPKLNINASGYSALKIVYLSCLILFIVYLIKLILHLISIRFIAGAGYKAIRDIRKKLYKKLRELPLNYFYKEKTGYLMSRLVNDVEFIAPVISSNLRDSITNIFYLITHLALLIYLNYKLFLISSFTVPLILIPMIFILRKIGKSSHRTQNLLAELSSILQEFLGGIKTIRSFVIEDKILKQLKEKNHRFSWRSFKEIFYLRMGPNIIELTSTLYTLAIIVLGVYYIDHTNFTGGEFFAFLLTTLFIIRPVIQLSSMIGKIQQASVAANRIIEFLNIPSDIKNPVKPKQKKPLKDSIVFENISFIYPETTKKVLDNISFKVKIGQTVAIVGESGSGKSTLMDLLARFFDPTDGRILFDGIDIRDFDIHDHRSRIGIVQQETFLFHGTIKENIAYGSPNYSMKDIERAARLAFAHDFIMQLPEGYDTIIGERGVNLSGGQRQRIAIARAIYYNPEILIFDEATSALDTKSEKLLQKALERLLVNRTTFIIAHRLSTIEKADLIVVLSQGRIVDIGTHETLIKKDGLYAKLQKISREVLE
ncbi:MAG: ABC transporter permease [Leptospiraceae bacterium]|nr:MAG: ABC transporter permease [Leptospiraceae bacterium]